MEIISFSNYRFKKLENLHLESCIMNTEGKLFIIPEKEKWEKHSTILKTFYNTEGSSFGNKLFTINSLIDSREEINIPELILPDKLAAVNGKVVGYTMPYIENINLSSLLNDNAIDNKTKIYYLKEIGKILEKMAIMRKKHRYKRFFLK